MAKIEIEKSVRKCKKCKTSTIHIRSAKRMTLSGLFVHLLLIILTAGLYIFPLFFGLLFGGNKEKWVCERCMDD